MDVARTIWVDPLCGNAHHELRFGIERDQLVVSVNRSRAIHANASLPLEVDEEQTDGSIGQHVPHGKIHPVAVVIWEGDGAIVDESHEPGIPTLVRAGW